MTELSTANMDLGTGEVLETGNGDRPFGVYAKIQAVMGQIGTIEKSGRNTFHNYDYVRESDLVDAIRPLMAEVGLVCVPSQGEREDVRVTTSQNRETTVAKILHTFRFVDTEDGSSVTVTVWGEGEDAMDKASYKAFTGAQKYALLKMFMVSTGDDPERDTTQPRAQAAAERSQPRREPTPQANGSPPASSHYLCPKCKSQMEDFRAEKEAGTKKSTFPDFRCTNDRCTQEGKGGKTYRFGIWGPHPDDEKDDAEAERISDLQHSLLALVDELMDGASKDEKRAGLIAYAQHEESLPDHSEDWTPGHFEYAIKDLSERGEAALFWAKNLGGIEGEPPEAEEKGKDKAKAAPSRPTKRRGEKKADLIAELQRIAKEAGCEDDKQAMTWIQGAAENALGEDVTRVIDLSPDQLSTVLASLTEGAKT